jgi:hypothetical protein
LPPDQPASGSINPNLGPADAPDAVPNPPPPDPPPPPPPSPVTPPPKPPDPPPPAAPEIPDPDPPDPPPPPPPSPCFLTTAVTKALGLPDDSEPLELARHLRDDKMTGDADRATIELYYKIAPVIVARSTDAEWKEFWTRHMRKITLLIKQGEYDLAKDLYTFATASLINAKATRYTDVELVDEVYDYGLKGFAKTAIPYPVRFVMLKAAFAVGLAYQSVRLNRAKRKFADLLEP